MSTVDRHGLIPGQEHHSEGQLEKRVLFDGRALHGDVHRVVQPIGKLAPQKIRHGANFGKDHTQVLVVRL